MTETAIRLRAMSIRSNSLPNAKRRIHYSDECYTPPTIPLALGSFDLDPCAGPMLHAKTNIRRPECGLEAKWKGRVWLNPPYSNVHLWLDKMIAHGNGIALVNARPETMWFQRACSHASAAFFLRSRVNFSRPDKVATHPPVGSVLIAFGKRNADALRSCSLPGVFMSIERGPREAEA